MFNADSRGRRNMQVLFQVSACVTFDNSPFKISHVSSPDSRWLFTEMKWKSHDKAYGYREGWRIRDSKAISLPWDECSNWDFYICLDLLCHQNTASHGTQKKQLLPVTTRPSISWLTTSPNSAMTTFSISLYAPTKWRNHLVLPTGPTSLSQGSAHTVPLTFPTTIPHSLSGCFLIIL